MPPPLRIGPHLIDPPLVLAPMAGVTDRCFRVLARRLGAGLAVSEMTLANPALRGTRKSMTRMDHSGEPGPISVQIAGSEPAQMAEAARYNVDHGAQIIDINMGCPAKKVCRRDAGSALMRDEALVGRILDAVVGAVDVPVTLKTRTGFDPDNRNVVRIARIAEAAGIQALAVHGRTRAEQYRGEAEYHSIAEVKAAVGIPVLANGDIRTPQRAREVLALTGADALMIGRGAQGRPWIFQEIRSYLESGRLPPAVDPATVAHWLLTHIDGLHSLYGAEQGTRVARKHIQWYCQDQPGADAFWQQVRSIEAADRQRETVRQWFADLAASRAHAA
jgi:tRNA-dihydrouridine synthase B